MKAIRMHTLSASAEGNLQPDQTYTVGPGGAVSEARARDLVAGGYAEAVGGETATQPMPEETATTAPEEEATQPEPDESRTEITVQQSGSWYTIYRDGEEVAKVQGEAAMKEAVAELEG